MEGKKTEDLYRQLGVSPQKEDVNRATASLDRGLVPDAFCRILPDYLGGDPEYAVIAHADGAGSKTSLAYVYWRETGDLSVWRGIAQDSIVMNVDDMMCAGASGPFVFTSSIDRHKGRVPAEVLEALVTGTEDFLSLLRSEGVEAYSGGGETADVGDLVRTITVNSAATTRLPRREVVDNQCIVAGDVIVGLCSYGQSSYEQRVNSGISSNGLTLARHAVLSGEYTTRYPESLDVEQAGGYRGSCLMTDAGDGALDVGSLLLSPTRTYAPVLRAAFRSMRPLIHGLIHCTGGAQTKVLKFVEGLRIVKNNLFDCPPVFHLIQRQGQVAWREMYEVFNMGHRLEVYMDADGAESLVALAERYQIPAKIIGRVEQAERAEVVIDAEFGTFTYT